jgi:myo-inositol 2-dehydrogenase/D-chiro-inositol 1-dehydrogenase
MKQVRVGVIGAGAVADIHHLPAYHELSEAKLVAVCDVNEERAKAMAKKYDAEAWYTDYIKLLERDDIDAVSICTPNFLHCEQTVAAAKHGKHVLVEKPMAVTIEECDKMIEACEKANVKLMVGANPRFDPQNQQIKEIIDKGTIGKILQIKYHAGTSGPYITWPAVSDWFFDESKVGGGCLIDLGAHFIDLLRWLTGDVSSVCAIAGNLSRNSKGEDNVMLLLTFKNGVLGELDMSWTYDKRYYLAEIHGTEGALFVGIPLAPIVVDLREGASKLLNGPIHSSIPKTSEETVKSIKKKIKNFLEAIINDKEPMITGRDGRAVMQIIVAAYESIRTGKRTFISTEHKR